jgi:hypothetical protein
MEAVKKFLFFLIPAFGVIFFAKEMLTLYKVDTVDSTLISKLLLIFIFVVVLSLVYITNLKKEEWKLLQTSIVFKIIFAVVILSLLIINLITLLMFFGVITI